MTRAVITQVWVWRYSLQDWDSKTVVQCIKQYMGGGGGRKHVCGPFRLITILGNILIHHLYTQLSTTLRKTKHTLNCGTNLLTSCCQLCSVEAGATTRNGPQMLCVCQNEILLLPHYYMCITPCIGNFQEINYIVSGCLQLVRTDWSAWWFWRWNEHFSWDFRTNPQQLTGHLLIWQDKSD